MYYDRNIQKFHIKNKSQATIEILFKKKTKRSLYSSVYIIATYCVIQNEINNAYETQHIQFMFKVKKNKQKKKRKKMERKQKAKIKQLQKQTKIPQPGFPI